MTLRIFEPFGVSKVVTETDFGCNNEARRDSIHSLAEILYFFGSKPIVVELSAGQLSSGAELLPIREFDQRIGLTEQFVQALGDRRRQRSLDHPFLQMVRMRIYGVLADYPDQNDHDLSVYGW